MGKFNLTDAAKAILTEGSKETFEASVKAGHKDGASKLPTSVAYGTKDVGEVAGVVDKTNDQGGDYTKGTPTATPPGATPPVGAEAGGTFSGQPGQTQGAAQTITQADPTDYASIRDRVKARLAQQTMQSNPGATFQSYAEETVAEEMKEKESKHEDEAQDKALIKKMMKKESMQQEIQDDVGALLAGEELSEEFKEKATTIFEAAVIARTQSVMEEIETALYEEFEVAVDQIKEDLATKLDDYINYMAEEWVKDNQIAIEKGLRAEIVEDFMRGLHNLFTEHYIEIPEEKVDVVEELTKRVEELEASLNEEINTAVQLTKELNEQKKNEAIHAVCEGLTQTQVEKLKALAEGVDFTTDAEFADKLVTLRESYFNTQVKTATSEALNEEVHIEDEKKPSASVDPMMAQYAQTISKTLVK
jgi:hypothetical protein